MNIYSKRKKAFVKKIQKPSLIILPAADEKFRNADTNFPFRQESHFYYLTGFNEPDAILVLKVLANKTESILFVRPNNPEKEVWTGKRAGIKGALKTCEVDQAYLINEFSEKLQQWLPQVKQIYYPFAVKPEFDRYLLNACQSAHVPFYDVKPLIGEMRLIKSPEEITLMRKAAQISAQAHVHGMQSCKPGMMEYELAAEYAYYFAKSGCAAPAYPPIVAGGANACILHYIENSAKLMPGELVLVDAGGEYENYASDITRTFPVNGKFTAEQRAVYEIVWRAQQAVIQALRPGVPANKSQEIATRVITEGLVELGILKGDVNNLVEKRAYAPYYMHNCSHWLGLDTHDAGSYKQNNKWRELKENMVLTVEPGIYLRPNKDLAPRWHNIGIRIEDDVLITSNGTEVLTSAVPNQLSEIESLIS